MVSREFPQAETRSQEGAGKRHSSFPYITSEFINSLSLQAITTLNNSCIVLIIKIKAGSGCTPAVLVPGKWRQKKHQEFKASLGYRGILKPV